MQNSLSSLDSILPAMKKPHNVTAKPQPRQNSLKMGKYCSWGLCGKLSFKNPWENQLKTNVFMNTRNDNMSAVEITLKHKKKLTRLFI